jgi:ribA/ribD-fused uncharacterized protein
MHEDFHPEIAERRKKLYPVVKAAKNQDRKATLIGDTLLIDSIRYTINDLEKLPDNLKYVLTGTKTSDSACAFFGYKSPLSNFFHAPFKEFGTEFHSVEQYFQCKKAELFNDEATASRIMAAKQPRQCKALGRHVQNYEKAKWHQNSINIMKRALSLKFCGNTECRQTLLNTRGKSLAEASYDSYWGTGVALSDENAANSAFWSGENHLGKLLQELRDSF